MILAGIVAGGSGSRMGGDMPKQFIELSGEPILIRTVKCFLQHRSVDAVVIGINPAWEGYAGQLIEKYFSGMPVYLTPGGADRNETLEKMVLFASGVLKCGSDSIILTHDSVRPFVSGRMIDDCIASMEKYPVSTAAVPETDTVAETTNGTTADGFPDRSTLRRIQTPQTIRIGTFLELFGSLDKAERSAATDLCSLCIQKGMTVGLVMGEMTNIKMTYPSDLLFAEAVIRAENAPE